MAAIKDFFIKGTFLFRYKVLNRLRNSLRINWYRLRGVRISRGAQIGPCKFNWPHKVAVGEDCIIEHNVFFKYDGPYSSGPSIIISDKTFIGNSCEFNISGSIKIGHTCLIASGCKFIDHDHGVAKDVPINIQRAVVAPIEISDEVWLGVNVVVLKGVRIGRGAVVAAGSVVTRDVGEYEIVGGIPAKFLRKRI